MGRSQLSEMRDLRKENEQIKRTLTELQLDKLILKESLCHLYDNYSYSCGVDE
jgi:putative transposase